jgi:hypothetical protein
VNEREMARAPSYILQYLSDAGTGRDIVAPYYQDWHSHHGRVAACLLHDRTRDVRLEIQEESDNRLQDRP